MRIARIFGIAFITGFSGAMMPGPMLVLTIGQVGAYRSMGPVWAIVGGHALLEIITVIMLVVGLRQVIQKPNVRGAIGLVGGAFLAWMGVDMVRNAANVTLDLGATDATMPWLQLVLAGAAVCIVNPYFVGWWATIGTGQLAHTAPCNFTEYLAFYLGHELSDLVWFSVVGLIIVTGASWLSPTVYTWLILICGAALVVLSLWFIWTGVRFIWLGAGESSDLPSREMFEEACAGAATEPNDEE